MFIKNIGLNRLIKSSNRFMICFHRNLSSISESINILGIETSCDDTGCAVINGAGKLIGESLHSQNLIHLRSGGINPTIARDLHRQNIEIAVHEALNKCGLCLKDIDYIAVTVKPGLVASLQIGVKYGNYISKLYKKPIIPVHHMEAHALAIRMFKGIEFPFLVLLISGGHCLLAIVNDVEEFLLLGKTVDNSPGEVFDKIARRMKLRNLIEYSKICGGQAIELAASKAKVNHDFKFPIPMISKRDCNFSFSGLRESVTRELYRKESEHKIVADQIIPEVNELCAGFLTAATEHLVHRTVRGIEYCRKHNLLPKKAELVVSGGVACNNFIYQSLCNVGERLDLKVSRPPPSLCTDNGVMIAWNGLEKLRKGEKGVNHFRIEDIQSKATFGLDITNNVRDANIPISSTKLKGFYVKYFNLFYSIIEDCKSKSQVGQTIVGVYIYL